ncbi:MAG: hypothetical protein ACE5J3_11290 [Methanosarcinales archaeon]
MEGGSNSIPCHCFILSIYRYNSHEVDKMNTMQDMFSIYCWVFVGIIGNGILGWEMGRKGLFQLGLEGPRNRRVLFAMYLWAIAVIWGKQTRSGCISNSIHGSPFSCSFLGCEIVGLAYGTGMANVW